MNYAHSVQLTIQNDLISKLGKTSLVDALIELIWNALDADALNVRVIFEGNGLDSLNSIKIIDDGVGIHFEPYRVCRRVNILRDYPDDKIKIYP
ncbi:ATP-binding protein [Acinetobacter baumannii]|uniref:ATP-binding protein n=1 Tax=Acinetobacter baumannii TaxID=470 RepID=UPI003EDF0233